MTNFNEIVLNIVVDFIHVWNKGDFEKIPYFLSDSIQFESPLISLKSSKYHTNVVKGKNEVFEYLKIAFNKPPYIIVDLNTLTFNKDSNKINLAASISNSDLKMLCTLILNEYGKFTLLKLDFKNNSQSHI